MGARSFKAFRWIWLSFIMIIVFGCSSPRSVITEEPEDEPVEETEPDEPEEDVREEEPVKTEKSDSIYVITSYTDVPDTPREFRGAWIATVDNIDWPSEPGLSVDQQKGELIEMLDRAKALNLNAIILQVRPAADALYHSPFEPWSEYLTGQQGKAPEPFYDPLKFAIKEAHRRGLELHAWLNPFRAYHPSAEGDLAPDHIKNMHPEMVVRYDHYYWLDPGQEKVRQYSIDIIADIVRRYDIDGVHLDDYFYPYPQRNSNGQFIPFPDNQSYDLYTQYNSTLKREDWRRQNVNRFIEQLNREIKLIDPHIRFGISPFGIWRPGYPRQIKGFDAFDRIYADARKWLREGWIDYLAPQLYWPIGEEAQSFPVLLEWWHRQNYKGRHLWPGIYTSKFNSKSDLWPENEIEQQLRIIQNHKGTTGGIHFSMKALMQDSDKADKISSDLYPVKALVPATDWLSQTAPPKPSAEVQKVDDSYVIRPHVNEEADFEPWLWVVKQRYGTHWEIEVYPGWKRSIDLPESSAKGPFNGAVISAVDEVGNESSPCLVREIKITS